MIKPSPIVEPICATFTRLEPIIANCVIANTSPAVVTTPPVPAIDRMTPVRIPALISSLKRDATKRL
ncbi:Uncharacterised protein [Mycobacteroides abscessus subsp. abscessus]|nr:Uncharacterised protein [Mycobacteroides abscessus subsp. abscessus]